jgi:sulfate adenylyltransferase subunit 2
LEYESIEILRKNVAEFREPVMFHSIGNDFSVLLHLARKAFALGSWPGSLFWNVDGA